MTNKTFVDEVSNIVKSFIYENVNLTMPAQVTSVDDYQSNQMLDVKPLINYFDEDNEAIAFDVIPSVIVCLEEAGGALISLPVKVGDRVTLEFSKQGLDNYLTSQGDSPLTPSDKRKFAITDCFARLGCPTAVSNLSPNPDDVEIKFAGSSWKMKPNGDVEEYVAGNRKTIVVGNYEIESSSLTHNGVNISETHVHEQGADSDGNTQVDTEVPK